MEGFTPSDRRPSRRTPETVTPNALPGIQGLFVAPSSYAELSKPELVDEHGMRVKPGGLLARAAAASLQRRRLQDRRLLTPNAALDAGLGDWACQTIEDARAQQDWARRTALWLKTEPGLRAAADFDEVRACGPLYGGTAAADLHTNVYRTGGGHLSPPIDVEAWRILERSLAPVTEPSTLRVPRGSAHGYPTFVTSDDDLYAHVSLGIELEAAAGSGRFLNVMAEVERLCPSGVGHFILTNTRLQHIKKAQAVHSWGPDGRLYKTGESSGVFPRTRLVRMVSTAVNEACRPVVQMRTDAYKTGTLGHCFSHGKRDVTLVVIQNVWKAARRRWGARACVVSSDLSNMDDTVGANHIVDAGRYLHYTPAVAYITSWLQEQPLLGGALYSGDEGFLFSRNMGVLSGQIATSQLDTAIRFSAGLDCLMAAGAFDSYAALEQAFTDQEAMTLVQGDDWLYIGPSFDRDKFIARSAVLGFKEKVEDYPVFLKTWYDPDRGAASGFASRAAVRTFTRERRAAGPLMEAFATGLRFQMAQADPNIDFYYQGARSVVPYLSEFPHWQGLLMLPFKYPGQFERELATPQGISKFRDALEVLQQHDAIQNVMRRLAQALPVIRSDAFQSKFDTYVDRTDRPGDWRAYLRRFRSERDTPYYERELEAAEGKLND